MPIFNKVNGKMREAWDMRVKVDGEWRQAIQFNKANGEWRQSYSPDIKADDIVGFKLVYKRCGTNMTHPDFENLSVNYDIPAVFHLDGEVSGEMNMVPKGVIFEYSNLQPDVEGILMYQGILLAVLRNGQHVDVSHAGSGEHRLQTTLQSIPEIWYTDKMNNLKIDIEAHVSYEANGFYVAGWDRFLSSEDFLDKTGYESTDNKNILEMNSYGIIPPESRAETFSSDIQIGIARDMHTKGSNMVGSYGSLNHTIFWINVDDEPRPFVIEIYK